MARAGPSGTDAVRCCLQARNGLGAVIITPTRELAAQVYSDLTEVHTTPHVLFYPPVVICSYLLGLIVS